MKLYEEDQLIACSRGFVEIYMLILHNSDYNCMFNLSYIILYILGIAIYAAMAIQ
jgi:hypothetical protein